MRPGCSLTTLRVPSRTPYHPVPPPCILLLTSAKGCKRTKVHRPPQGEIGSNGYGWFTFNDIDGLAIDNTGLTVGTQNPIPEPGTVGLMVLGLAGLVGVRSWRRRSR